MWRYNRSLLSGLLFQAVQHTLKDFSSDARYLSATPGFLSALHTWGRNLSLHPHLHVLISHGGINAEGQWVVPKKSQLFPQKPVMMVFRGKLLSKLKAVLKSKKLQCPPNETPHQLNTLFNRLGRKLWVVHFCQRYDHANGVAKYLARYVKGGPFRNSQICEETETQLSFRYQSHQTRRTETLNLSIKAFIRRLIEHVPLPGKPGFRYCGLYASTTRTRLNQARTALGQTRVGPRESLSWISYMDDRGYRPLCQICAGPLFHRESVVREAA